MASLSDPQANQQFTVEHGKDFMRKIIEGKRYDTDTATHVANHNNGHSRGDFHWINEDLYQTPKGNRFVHGSGGAKTHYVRQPGSNEWSGSQDIFTLSPQEALKWLEEHGQTAAIEKYFGAEDA